MGESEGTGDLAAVTAVPPDPELVLPPPPPAPLMVTVAETVPAGGVAVTNVEQFGLELQLAATGVVDAPATEDGTTAVTTPTDSASAAAAPAMAATRARRAR